MTGSSKMRMTKEKIMKKGSKELLEHLSQQCSVHITRYKYNNTLNISTNYRKGHLSILNWIQELLYYYLQQEKRIATDLYRTLEDKKKELMQREDNEYRQGVIDALDMGLHLLRQTLKD